MNKVTRNFLYNITGNIGSKILSFLIVAFTTRMFGSVVFGEYNIAAAEFSYFSMFAVMGMNGYGLFLFAKEQDYERRKAIINDVCTVKTISGCIMAVVLLIYAFLLPNTHSFIFPYFIMLMLQALDVSWAFNALQDMKLTAYASMIIVAINAVLVFGFYYTGNRSVYALIISGIVSTLVLQMIYVICLKKKHGFKISLHRTRYLTYLRRGFPYVASGLFAGINTNIDLVIMGYTLDGSQVGYYSANYKLVYEFIAICTVVFTPLFPVFIEKIGKKELAYINRVTGYLRTILMSAIVPCALVGIFYGKEILGLLFGKEYEAGYSAFAILMIFVVLLYYREIYGYVLTAAGKQSLYLRIVAISGGFNLITNLIFIPQYGIVAAAITTVVSEVINLVGMKYYVNKHVKVKIDNYNLQKLIYPLLLLGAALLVCKQLNLIYWLSILLCCILYLVSYLGAKIIDVKLIKSIFAKG